MRGVRFVELDASRRVTRHALTAEGEHLGQYWEIET